VSGYTKGRTLEWEARKYLAGNGYEVFRSAGSKTKVDLIAIKPGDIVFVQCKVDGYLPPAERTALRNLALMVKAQPVVCWWHKDGRAARVLTFRQLISGLVWTADHGLYP
jgi:Holliday junction resolvase